MSMGESIAAAQAIIDESDPFLVEALHGKSSDEIFEYITKLQAELERINRMNNESWAANQKELIKTAHAIYSIRLMQEDTNKQGHIVA